MKKMARYLLGGAIIVFGWAQSSQLIWSQSESSFGNIDSLVFSRPEESDIVFGVAAPAIRYSVRQAAKWGIDFFVAPSRATDRSIMYGYKLSEISGSAIQSLFIREKPKDILIAFVVETASGPFPTLGGDRAYLAAPVIEMSARLRDSREFADVYGIFVKAAPAFVAISSLAASGIDVNKLQYIPPPKADSVYYITINKPIPGLKVDQYFIVGESVWKVGDKKAESTWGLRFSK